MWNPANSRVVFAPKIADQRHNYVSAGVEEGLLWMTGNDARQGLNSHGAFSGGVAPGAARSKRNGASPSNRSLVVLSPISVPVMDLYCAGDPLAPRAVVGPNRR